MDRDKGQSLLNFVEDYTVIDIETTGLDPKYDEIIEVAAIKFKNGNEIDRYCELIKPENPIDEFVTELTGITDEMVKYSRSIDNVIKDYVEFIGDSVLIGHNINFDINFIYDTMLKLYNTKFQNNFIDTMRLSRRISLERRHHRLKDVAEYYKIAYYDAHRALRDVEITHEIYKKLQEEIISQYGSAEVLSKRLEAKD